MSDGNPPTRADEDGTPPAALLAGRFRVLAHLGSGAFGTVVAAVDERDGARVAIKRLKRATGASIYRFKREFRALADLRHPNLVRLYELFSDGEDWLFSMELVDGVPFDVHILGEDAGHAPESTAPERPIAAPVARADTAPAPDVVKLRAALPQLVDAIAALHARGVVHRDLKPQNVLVTPEGRVVVLDFGLATDADPEAQQSTLGVVAGTPAYMAPEQALGRVTTPASDAYALGVMLFEVLFGRRPFTGTAHDALSAKLSSGNWRFPQSRGHAVDLEELARALLAPEPADRPDGARIAAIVGAPTRTPEPEGRAPTFVGRARELSMLRAAFAASERGRTVVAHVRGPSGVGKSALIRELTQQLGPEVLVLSGRCYEREQVPYKALDGVVDALTRTLRRMSVADAALLVPREARALCRLFPVFSRLQLFAEQPERVRASSPHDERRRGVLALREMLARIADRRPVVVVIDDLQWGDLDSIEPLRALLAPPDAPPLLLVLAYRAEDQARSAALTALAAAPLAPPENVHDIDVAPLDAEDAFTLAERLLPEALRHHASAIARESGGLPFYLPELARAQERLDGHDDAPSLGQVVRARAGRMSEDAQRLLTVIAVAGRPVPRRVAVRAAGLDTVGSRVLDELIEQSFVRSAPSEDALLEPFHDRVRESVAASVSPDQTREIHRALAAALVDIARIDRASADPEALAEHYRQAGDLTRARPAAIAAAERATDALAFERAIALLSVAREDAPSEERRSLTARLADVLAYAGKSREAADAYLEAVSGAPEREARALRLRAATALLRCGAIAEGLAIARALAHDFGLSWPESRGAVLASVIVQKLRLRLRGTGTTERALAPDDDNERMILDLYWTLGTGLSPVDIARAADYEKRYLLRALDVGEPYRVARGLALEALFSASEGAHACASAEKHALRAGEIATRIKSAHALGWSKAALSVTSWVVGRWRRAASLIEEAVKVMRDGEPEGVWELAMTEIWFRHRSLFFLGELEEFERASDECLRAAAERGDQLTLTTGLYVGRAHVRLVRGRVDEAREASESGVRAWTHEGWHFQHQGNLRTQTQCDLYEGDGARALRRVNEHWERVRRSLLLRTETERIQAFGVFTSAALHARDLTAAQRWLGRLESTRKNPWGRAFIASAQAGVLALKGEDGAPLAYERAAAELDALEMTLWAAAARRRRGELIGGDEGAQLVREADALLSARGVAEPARWARMLVA